MTNKLSTACTTSKARLIAFCFILFGHIASAQRTIQLFNHDWRFYKGDAAEAKNAAFNDASWRAVTLPHDWSIEGPFSNEWASATGYLPGGIGWYRKAFTIAPNLRSKNIFLYFDGVYRNSEVWINGHYLGKRPNGYVSFQYEITKYINKTGKNTVAVKADHTDFADSRWYTGSGIYRNVYLVATDAVHVDLWGVKFSTPAVSPQQATASVVVTVANQTAAASPVVVQAQLIDQKGKVVAKAQKQLSVSASNKADATLSFNVTNPSLWSVENPALYKLHVSILKAGKKIDEMTDEVGFRWFRFDKDKGFFLNGRNMKLKGVCLHDDAGALGVAVPEEVWERRLILLKDAGCNSIRMSHNPHADYLYRLMDRMGFLVMDEAFDEWELGKNKWIKGWNVGQPGKDGPHTFFKEWGEQDLRDMILRNYNRPSIIFWSIGNEIDYPNDPYTHEILNTGRNPQIFGKGYQPNNPPASRLGEMAKRLVAVAKQYDTTRPVTAALAGVVMSNETTYPRQLDVVGYNYQEYRYPDDHKAYPSRTIYGSENGHQYNNWKAVTDNDYISGQYLWTGIDYLGEARTWPSRSNEAGLMDLAGFPKSEYYFRQSLWADAPMIYIGTTSGRTRNNLNNKRNIIPSWNYKEGDSIRVSCFTNCDDAELFLNGKSLGRKKMSEGKDKVLAWDLIYAPGELVVKGYRGIGEAADYRLKTSGEPVAIKAISDKTTLSRSRKELAHITIDIVGKNGVTVYDANNEISINIEGPAELLGLESGSSTSHEDYKAGKRKAFNGKLLAYIQSKPKNGVIKLTITSPGLETKIIELK